MEIDEEIKDEIDHVAHIIVKELEVRDSVFMNIQILEEYSQYDVLFSYGYANYGIHQRGIRANYLIISVIGFGAFGFDVNIHDTDPEYYTEKLNIKSNYLAMLFNKVRKLLKKSQ